VIPGYATACRYWECVYDIMDLYECILEYDILTLACHIGVPLLGFWVYVSCYIYLWYFRFTYTYIDVYY